MKVALTLVAGGVFRRTFGRFEASSSGKVRRRMDVRHGRSQAQPTESFSFRVRFSGALQNQERPAPPKRPVELLAL
jgi:hypothetical protein